MRIRMTPFGIYNAETEENITWINLKCCFGKITVTGKTRRVPPNARHIGDRLCGGTSDVYKPAFAIQLVNFRPL